MAKWLKFGDPMHIFNLEPPKSAKMALKCPKRTFSKNLSAYCWKLHIFGENTQSDPLFDKYAFLIKSPVHIITLFVFKCWKEALIFITQFKLLFWLIHPVYHTGIHTECNMLTFKKSYILLLFVYFWRKVARNTG